MEYDSDQADGLLRQPSSQLSDYSLNSNATLVNSPPSPSLHRHVQSQSISTVEEDSADLGLGISSFNDGKRGSIKRTVLASESSPGSADLLLSPMSTYRPGEDRLDEDQEYLHLDSKNSSHRPFKVNSDCEPLQKKLPPTEAHFECRMRKPPESGRGSWLAVIILMMSIYSTIFSGIWLVIAITKVHYGRTVSRGGVPFTMASTLYAAFAKSIELSFVTVFVAFIGQALSRKALIPKKGITIAEMTMRSWVMQPGTMISHAESLRYAAATRLGVFALLVALMAMIYTTASDALVTPVLKFGKTENHIMYGKVSTSFANTKYITDNCNTPIEPTVDPDNYGQTCIQIEHSGQAYHNYMQYLTTWVDNIKSGNLSNNITKRPDPVGMVRIPSNSTGVYNARSALEVQGPFSDYQTVSSSQLTY